MGPPIGAGPSARRFLRRVEPAQLTASAATETAMEPTAKAATETGVSHEAAVADVRMPVVAAPIAAVPSPGRVKPEAERAPVGAQPDERVIPHVRIPIPSWIEAGFSGIFAGDLVIGFGQIFRAQAAPVIELVLGIAGVEAGGLYRSVDGQCHLVMVLDHPGHAIAFPDHRFAFEDQRGGLVGVELVEAGFDHFSNTATTENLKRILRVEFVDFESSAAAIDFNLRWRDVRRNHLDSAVIVDAQKHARRQQ